VKVRGLLGTTGGPVDFNNGIHTTNGLKAPVVQQGGGLVNALRFVKATTVIEPAFLELNVCIIPCNRFRCLANSKDTAHFQGVQNIRLTNNGSETVMFTFGVIHAATAYVLDPSETMISTFPPSINIAPVVNITLSTTTLLLAPSASANITAQFVFQLQDVDPVLLPIYSGYITVQSNASGDLGGLQIPFLGAAFNMTTLPIYDRVDGFPTFTGTAHNGTFFTADGTIFTMTNNDFPKIDFRLIFGTRVLQLDALPGTNTTTTGTQPFAGLNTLGYISRPPHREG
jgi:hypothetical protein